MWIFTLQWFTCVFKAIEKCSSARKPWQWPLHPRYLVVRHEESTDGAVRLHSGHGWVILLLSHKVWRLRLPKVDQRLRPRLRFFHFLLNQWNLRQFWRNRAWKYSEQGTQGETTLVFQKSKYSTASLLLMWDRKPILSFKYILREVEHKEFSLQSLHLQGLDQVWWPDNHPPFDNFPPLLPGITELFAPLNFITAMFLMLP